MRDKGRVFPITKKFVAWPATLHVQQQSGRRLGRRGISIQNKVTVITVKLSKVVSTVLLSAEFVEGFVDSVN